MNQSTSLAFLGDIRVPSDSITRTCANPFSEVNDWLSQSDLVVANLEGPIGAGGTPRTGRGALLFNDSGILQLIAPWKQTLCVLANNHMMDFGGDGLARTLRALDERGVPYVGAGMDEQSARAPCILDVGGRSCGFLAFTTEEPHVGSICAHGSSPGCAELDPAGAREAVHSLSGRVDNVCVILHWGHEFHAYPTPEQVSWISDLVRAGARVVVGHHPHVLQGIQKIGDSLVAYSLGNCLFPPFEQTNGRMSVQSAEEREFLLLKVHLRNGAGPQHEFVGGSRGVEERLDPFVRSGHKEFESKVAILSEPLSAPDYDTFYAAFAQTRRVELERQQLWKSLKKIRLRDVSSIRMADIQRFWRRVTTRR